MISQTAGRSAARRASPPTQTRRRAASPPDRPGAEASQPRSVEVDWLEIVISRSASHAARAPMPASCRSRQCRVAPAARAENVGARAALKAGENRRSSRSSEAIESPAGRSLETEAVELGFFFVEASSPAPEPRQSRHDAPGSPPRPLAASPWPGSCSWRSACPPRGHSSTSGR